MLCKLVEVRLVGPRLALRCPLGGARNSERRRVFARFERFFLAFDIHGRQRGDALHAELGKRSVPGVAVWADHDHRLGNRGVGGSWVMPGSFAVVLCAAECISHATSQENTKVNNSDERLRAALAKPFSPFDPSGSTPPDRPSDLPFSYRRPASSIDVHGLPAIERCDDSAALGSPPKAR